MQAALTSKGQLTLPKPARDALGLVAGTLFEVQVTAQGAITLTPTRCDPLGIFGLLAQPQSAKKAPSIKAIDAAIGQHLAAMDERIRSTGSSAEPSQK